MERLEAIAIFLKEVKQAYIKDQQDKNIRASGRSANSIREVSTKQYGRLFGAGYFYFQRVGRKPGKFPPIEAIKQWIEEKNLDLNPFAVARKIAKKGTDIFLKRRPGLNIEDKILEPRKALARNMAMIEREGIIRDFKKKLGITAISLTILFTGCSSSLTVNGYKVKDATVKSVTHKERNLYHLSFVCGFSLTNHFVQKKKK